MADANAYLAPLRDSLIPVPAVPQDGICQCCHSGVGPEYNRCYLCEQESPYGTAEILPITMSVHGELIHHHLRNYKDSPSAEARDRLTMRLAALLAVFVQHHASCIGEWDVVTTVPSAQRVAMEPIVGKIRRFEHDYERLLVGRPEFTGRNLDPDQFRVTGTTRDRRVLLLDDTFTSGAKLFSAAQALRLSGAAIVGPVVIGRHVQPSWAPSGAMLEWLSEREWNETRCCRCEGEVRDEGALF